eukprot:6278700-Prymnesium_polylepis.1
MGMLAPPALPPARPPRSRTLRGTRERDRSAVAALRNDSAQYRSALLTRSASAIAHAATRPSPPSRRDTARPPARPPTLAHARPPLEAVARARPLRRRDAARSFRGVLQRVAYPVCLRHRACRNALRLPLPDA